MDEVREEREELEALQADVDDLRREQEAEERFWTVGGLTEAESRVLVGGGQKGCALCEDAAKRLGVEL